MFSLNSEADVSGRATCIIRIDGVVTRNRSSSLRNFFLLENVCSQRRTPDADAARVYDHGASREGSNIRFSYEGEDKAVCGERAHAQGPKQNDPRMSARREFPQVSEKRDQLCPK
jgi:hypothetical protein